MAIGFIKSRYVSRSTGGNACNSSAYNARTKILDEHTGQIYNWTRKGDDIYHEMLLPEYVDKKFKNLSILSNTVEANEHQKNSQVYIEWVIALPKEEEVTLEMKKELVYRFIKYKNWIEEGVGVQIDIHKPHENEDNWHAHLLVTTRRFSKDGLGFEHLKARDLQPKVVNGIVVEETKDTIAYTNIQNDYYKECGLELRVDLPGELAQEHIGPVRMRSVLNEAVIRNEERKLANIEALKDGGDVIARVTKGASVFNKNDLVRAVKCVPDGARANELVEDALRHAEIIPLYQEGGASTDLYTTKLVRSEELKLMRLSSYIANQKNLVTGNSNTVTPGLAITKIIKEDLSLNTQQCDALSHLLLADSGIRILKGRAGTGKSYVLGKVASIARNQGVNVIGLAPTHKAKQGLSKVGYDKCDTIKGFLFKLYNGKADLARGSLIVIDEAGMVDNDDYSELLRVLAAKSCNVILAGDERQLSSIGRGGMFEAFADKFGEFEMNDIRRQELDWGREVAISFSRGDVRQGINILKSNNRLLHSKTKVDSMESLLNSWNNSLEPLENRLIIAIKNADVDSLNLGARELLKAKGALSGVETIITKNNKHTCFATGDRIVFNQSCKELSVSNGDFGMLIESKALKFTVKLDQGREVEFNPQEFNGFKHGYASTVYKAQGASIRDVYVLHDGFSTSKNSYVAMSRHIKDLHLYTNFDATRTVNHLIKQLNFTPESFPSISYYTKEDLKARATLENKGILAKTYDKVSIKLKSQITSFIDKASVDRDYYVFEKPEVSKVEVGEILELVNEYKGSHATVQGIAVNEGILELEERVVVGGYNVLRGSNDITSVPNNITSHAGHGNDAPSVNISTATNRKITPKEKFYANRDYKLKQQATKNIDYEQESMKLRGEVKWSAEKIAINLLGEPNKRLSDGKELRFGKSGSIAVRISGEKCGNWYDFKEGKGGDLFDLVQDIKACDFKEAADYLRSTLGISNPQNSNIIYLHNLSDKYVDHHKQKASVKAEEVAALKKVENLYNRSKSISGNSVAAKYLEGRGINCILSNDIRTAGQYTKELGKTGAAIVAFARNGSGKITGGQQILLDSVTYKKADIAAPKKSFGKIAGSFVEVASHPNSNSKENNDNKITVIAEGLETALSIKQAGVEARIICALGLGNIKNYQPKEGERIIIAADHDKVGSNSEKIIEDTKNILSKQALVITIKPSVLGDFNDVLLSGNDDNHQTGSGAAKIRELFDSGLLKLNSYTKEQAAIIIDYEQYKYKQSGIDEYMGDNQEHVDNLRKFNPNYDISKLKAGLADFTDYTREKLIEHELKQEFKPYITAHEQGFKVAKVNADSLDKLIDIYAKEKEFCGEVYNKHYKLLSSITHQNKENRTLSTYTMHLRKPSLLANFVRDLSYATKLGLIKEDRLFEDLQKSKDIRQEGHILFNKCEVHNIMLAEEDINRISTKGFAVSNGVKFTEIRTYLENKIHDKALRPYIQSFATNKLFEINKLAITGRLGQYKQIRQQQELEQQRKTQELQKIHELEHTRSM
jgi:Ti-type conjugative transfer relaxase TraA